jgi:hypothetical protein
MRPGCAGVFRSEDAVLANSHDFFLVTAEKGALPDVDRRSLRLPTRALVLADEQAVRGPQVMGALKQDRNPRLRIGGGDLGPSDPGVRAAVDALALAVNEVVASRRQPWKTVRPSAGRSPTVSGNA